MLAGFLGIATWRRHPRQPQSAKIECCRGILQGRCQTQAVLTAFGVAALSFMMLMYALERRGRGFILAFGCGCLLASTYGFLAGTWPFGVVEAIWAGVAFNRYRNTPT